MGTPRTEPDPTMEPGAFHHLTVYRARRIRTMTEAMPTAEAVAVASGRIVAVGTLESLGPWLDRFPHTVDERFAGDVLFPGATTPDAYVARLRELYAQHDNGSVPFIVWGFHPLWHGDQYRPQLDALFPDRPVVLWHRSFHELVLNTAALEWFGLREEEVRGRPNSDWDRGHFWANGAGTHTFFRLCQQAGVTTVLDRGVGIFGDAVGEIGLIRELDILQRLPERKPRFGHRTTLEHFASTSEDQCRRMAELGMLVSANPYDHHILSDVFSAQWLGNDRGSEMVRLSPLTLAWAAWILLRENEIGSIRADKRADVAVLADDPYDMGAEGLRDIAVKGVVFEGKPHPL